MTRGFAKALVNLYGIAFVLGGVAAAFHTKAVIGAFVLLFGQVRAQPPRFRLRLDQPAGDMTDALPELSLPVADLLG